MENQDQKEKSEQQLVKEDYRADLLQVRKATDQVEAKYLKNFDLTKVRKGLFGLLDSLHTLNLIPKNEVLAKDENGRWEADYIECLVVRNKKSSYPEHYYLTTDGSLYKIINERGTLTLDDVHQWEEISPFAAGLPKWSNRIKVNNTEYRKLVPAICEEIRFIINQASEI